MTVPIETSQVVYAGNGATTLFNTVFNFLKNSHVLVELKPAVGVYGTQTEGTHYTLAGAGTDAPGTVTMLTAPPLGSLLRISRNPLVIQETDLRNFGPFLAETHEKTFDYCRHVDQMLLRRILALEAGAVGSTYTAVQVVIASLTPGDPVEGAPFPLTVPCGVVPKTIVVGRVENLTTPGEVRFEAPTIPQFTVSGTDAVIPYITGLTPGQEYRITLEVRT